MLKRLLNRKLPFKPPKLKLKDLRKKGKKLLVWLLSKKLKRKLKDKRELDNCRRSLRRQDVLQRNKRWQDWRQKRLLVSKQKKKQQILQKKKLLVWLLRKKLSGYKLRSSKKRKLSKKLKKLLLRLKRKLEDKKQQNVKPKG